MAAAILHVFLNVEKQNSVILDAYFLCVKKLVILCVGKRARLWNLDQHCCLSCRTAVHALPLATSSILVWIGDVSSHLLTRRLSWLRNTFSSMSTLFIFMCWRLRMWRASKPQMLLASKLAMEAAACFMSSRVLS